MRNPLTQFVKEHMVDTPTLWCVKDYALHVHCSKALRTAMSRLSKQLTFVLQSKVTAAGVRERRKSYLIVSDRGDLKLSDDRDMSASLPCISRLCSPDRGRILAASPGGLERAT